MKPYIMALSEKYDNQLLLEQRDPYMLKSIYNDIVNNISSKPNNIRQVIDIYFIDNVNKTLHQSFTTIFKDKIHNLFKRQTILYFKKCGVNHMSTTCCYCENKKFNCIFLLVCRLNTVDKIKKINCSLVKITNIVENEKKEITFNINKKDVNLENILELYPTVLNCLLVKFTYKQIIESM